MGGLGDPLSVEECWKTLPAATLGGGQRLPNWPSSRPWTPRGLTAMLDLDRLHRTRNPIGPVLRGEMRWVAADANRCEYARATAEADLRRAGPRRLPDRRPEGGPDRLAAPTTGPRLDSPAG